MLVVVASSLDADAAELVTSWAEHDAALLTVRDLSTQGWRHRLGQPESSSAVIEGRVVPPREVQGVLTRRPWVFPEELTHVIGPDRDYVAAELSAFLVSWLSELTCPVINRPTPTCLSGPGWRQPQWVHLAARLDIRVSRNRWEISLTTADEAVAQPAETVEVIVVDGDCFGAPDPATAAAARRLAAAAGVRLVGLRFAVDERGPMFVSASIWPGLGDSAVRDAVLHGLLSPTRTGQ